VSLRDKPLDGISQPCFLLLLSHAARRVVGLAAFKLRDKPLCNLH